MNHLTLTTPLNIAEEKKRFFASAEYEPQFVYDWDPVKLKWLDTSHPELVPISDALLAQKPEAIIEAGSIFFDVMFRPEDLKLAEQLVCDIPQQSRGGAQELAAALVKKLAELGIDYRVEVVDRHGFKCRPDHRAKVVWVSSYLRLQFPSAESVANHELVHIIRAVNRKYNKIPQQERYLPTEEGLACLVQDQLFARSTRSAFMHALEYLAADLSRRASFRTVYDFLRDHGCDAENAWSRGIRCKFGLTDTSQPGSLLKPAMYFYQARLLSALSQDELLRLFVGKIRRDQLDEYKVYSGVVSAENIRRLWS